MLEDQSPQNEVQVMSLIVTSREGTGKAFGRVNYRFTDADGRTREGHHDADFPGGESASTGSEWVKSVLEGFTNTL